MKQLLLSQKDVLWPKPISRTPSEVLTLASIVRLLQDFNGNLGIGLCSFVTPAFPLAANWLRVYFINCLRLSDACFSDVVTAVVVYLDDFFIKADSFLDCVEALNITIYNRHLSWYRNWFCGYVPSPSWWETCSSEKSLLGFKASKSSCNSWQGNWIFAQVSCMAVESFRAAS